MTIQIMRYECLPYSDRAMTVTTDPLCSDARTRIVICSFDRVLLAVHVELSVCVPMTESSCSLSWLSLPGVAVKTISD